MNNQQWQEGVTYQFRQDMIEEFKYQNSSNEKIANLIRYDTFTIKKLGDVAGTVRDLVEFRGDDLNIEYWFTADEIKFFKLVEDNTQATPMNDIRPEPAIVMEWLDKLQYVLQVDTTVGDNLVSTPSGMVLDADYGSIYGTASIYNFITNRYDLLQQEAKHKKNNELIERKAKLEAELAEVNKELGNV